MILVPPNGAGAWHLAIWGLILSIGTTATGLAYAAWGAELTPDYAERNRVTAFRETVTVIGTVLVTATPALLPAFGFTKQMDVLWAIAIAIAVLLPLFGLLAMSPCRSPRIARSPGSTGARGWRISWRTNPSCAHRGILPQWPRQWPAGEPFLFFVAERLGAAGKSPCSCSSISSAPCSPCRSG